MNSCPCSEEEYYYKLDNMLLSSCQHLRTIFKARWKSETGEEWLDVQDNAECFTSGLGRNAFKKAKPFEKAGLKNHRVEEWDIALMCMVLQNFGCPQKYKNEHLAVRELKAIRNILAHHSSKKMPKEEYRKHVQIIQRSLLDLGMQDKDISALIEKPEVTSILQAIELFEQLTQKAEHFVSKGEIQSSIACYSEAIEIPSLLPDYLAMVYEKGAECFLKFANEPNSHQENCSQALIDIDKAMTLNESSWMVHYLAAQCHKLQNNLEKSIHHFHRSLSISPGQTQVKRDLESCKVLAADQNINHHLNPGQMPMNLQERLAHLHNETGMKMNEDTFRKFQLDVALIRKGHDDVFRGHQHFEGWNVPQNFTEAAKYYEKAATVKNVEGTYNLARCYHYGYGVTQNIQRALRMYHEVDDMPPETSSKFMLPRLGIGVADAQHMIGLLYCEGIGVDQSYVEAAKWYRRAMENGVGYSANNLAILYSNGNGVPQDMKMAELCWKEAVILKDPNAPAALVDYYMNQIEPDKALEMLSIGREMGNSKLINWSDEKLNEIIAGIKSDRAAEESTISEFERANNLSAKGLTFAERLVRRTCCISYSEANIKQIVERISKQYEDQNANYDCKTQIRFSIKIFRVIQRKANEGSARAKIVSDSLKNSIKLETLLSFGLCKTKEEKRKIINLLYKCITMEPRLVWLSAQSIKWLTVIVSELFEKCCDEKGDHDIKLGSVTCN